VKGADECILSCNDDRMHGEHRTLCTDDQRINFFT
jgi:hypothetical protein